MRWVFFMLLAYLAIVVQTSLAAVLAVPSDALGMNIRPDLLIAVAVFISLRVRAGTDAVLAGWVLGLLMDLTTINTPIGMYAITFALAAAVVYRTRDAVFTDNPLTQFVLGLVCCLLAQGAAVLFANLAVRDSSWRLWRELAGVLLVAVYTAIATPVLCWLLRPAARALFVQPVGRGRW